MAWTEEMVEELKKLWDEGVTTGEIGRRLNISKNSIVGKVHRLGLSGRPSPIKKKDVTSDDKNTTPTTKEKKSTTITKETKKEVKEVSTSPTQKTTEQKNQKTIQPQPVQAKSEPVIISSDANEEEDIKLAKSLNLAQSNLSKKDYISLTDLDNHTCRWPIGDPKDENFHFCGKKVRLGQTYCEEHAAIAYVKPTKK